MTKTLESYAPYSIPETLVNMTPLTSGFLVEERANLEVKALEEATYISSGTDLVVSVMQWEAESLAWQDDLDSLDDAWPAY